MQYVPKALTDPIAALSVRMILMEIWSVNKVHVAMEAIAENA